MQYRVLALLAPLVCSTAIPAWTWGPIGHRTIALLAEQRLSPEVRERVRKLLLDGKYSMAQVSTCPDALRPSAKYPMRPEDRYCLEVAAANPDSAPWHYIDIPVPKAEKALEAYCPHDNCITAKIRQFRDTLKNSNDDVKRREALVYLIHFVGDIHQPLHCAERNCDQGGNLEHCNIFLSSGERPDHRLHRAWDEDLPDKWLEDNNLKSEQDTAAALNSEINPRRAAKWQKTSIDEIAWEGWELARKDVYKTIPIYNYCDPGVKANRTPASDLSSSYEKEAEKIIREQWMKAGVRLADLLESALTR